MVLDYGRMTVGREENATGVDASLEGMREPGVVVPHLVSVDWGIVGGGFGSL